jgi:hypothetical protein
MLETRSRTTPIAVDRRPLIRRTAAGIAVLIALIYFLIGFQLVAVLENTSEQTAFGLIAGGAFVIGAALILAFDRRWLWTMGTLAQLFIIWTYFNLADQRAPDFEFWGVVDPGAAGDPHRPVGLPGCRTAPRSGGGADAGGRALLRA